MTLSSLLAAANEAFLGSTTPSFSSNTIKSSNTTEKANTTSFAYCPMCPGEKMGPPVTTPMPGCMLADDGGKGNCRTPEEIDEARKYIRGVNRAVQNQLKEALYKRKMFERRSCEYQIAIAKGNPDLKNQYGPNGPNTVAGSYLFQLKQWRIALDNLKAACSQDPACTQLLHHMRTSRAEPALATPFNTWTELKKACTMYTERKPVPNTSDAWCRSNDPKDHDCEIRSCKAWWRQEHPNQAAWIDGHPDYEQIKHVCNWVLKTPKSSVPLSALFHQEEQLGIVEERREKMCTPQKVEGYCEKAGTSGSTLSTKCTLPDGASCAKGRILPHSTSRRINRGQKKIILKLIFLYNIDYLKKTHKINYLAPIYLTSCYSVAMDYFDEVELSTVISLIIDNPRN